MPTTPTTSTGSVTYEAVVGNVTVRHPGGSAQPLKSVQTISEGDEIRTGSNSRAVVQFEDGSIIRVAPSSQITLDAAQFDKQGRLANVSISWCLAAAAAAR